MVAPDPNESLQALLHVTATCEGAFHAAAAAARGEEVRALLLDRAYRFTRAAGALRAIAEGYGIALEPPAALSGADRSAGDDLSLLADCERREEHAIVAFRDALEAPLPVAVRRALEHEFDSLLGSLGSLRALRDRLDDRRRDPAPESL